MDVPATAQDSDTTNSNGYVSSSSNSSSNPLSDIEAYLDSTEAGSLTASQYTTALQASYDLDPTAFGTYNGAGLYPFQSLTPSLPQTTSSFTAADLQSNGSKPTSTNYNGNTAYTRKSQYPTTRRQLSYGNKRSTGRAPQTPLPEGQPRSKRQIKRAKIIQQHGSVSALDRPKGETRERSDGLLEWYDGVEEVWHLAAPLDQYRRRIIEEDDANDTYDFEPASGLHKDDITTFPPSDDIGMKYWNVVDRKSWGTIQDEESNEVLYLLERPDTRIDTPEVGYMMYDGLIMLDPDDDPIFDWPGIPRLFSSAMEGARIESMRRIWPWLSLPQFRARMPRTIEKPTGETRPLFGISSLSQRLARFREVMECPAWRKHGRGTNNKEHTLARLSLKGIRSGTTEDLSPIARWQAEKRKSSQKGKFPENAGTYTLSELERQQVEAKYRKSSRKAPDTKKRSRDEFEDSDLLDTEQGSKRVHSATYPRHEFDGHMMSSGHDREQKTQLFPALDSKDFAISSIEDFEF